MKMNEELENRKKKALAVTILIPMQKGEDEMDDAEEEKEAQDVDLAPVKKEKEAMKKDFLKGSEGDLARMKKEKMKPKTLEEKAMMEMMDEKD